jgi:hypothetical protein
VSPHPLQRDSETELRAGIVGILSGRLMEKVDRLSMIAREQSLQALVAQRRRGFPCLWDDMRRRRIRCVSSHGLPTGFIATRVSLVGLVPQARAAHARGPET